MKYYLNQGVIKSRKHFVKFLIAVLIYLVLFQQTILYGLVNELFKYVIGGF